MRKLVSDAVALGDLVQGDPHAGGVADVVVEVVARRPPRHRALLDPVLQATAFGLLEQRHEALLELDQVLIHRLRLVASDEAGDGGSAEQGRRVHHPQHEVVLLAADRRVLVEHVVEVGDVGDGDAAVVDGCEDPLGAHVGERLAEVERVGDRIEHRLGRDVGDRGVERGGQLDAVGVERFGEVQPLLHGEIGVGVASLAWRQLLERGGEHSDRHVDRGERGWFGHGWTSDDDWAGCDGWEQAVTLRRGCRAGCAGGPTRWRRAGPAG